MSTGPDTPEIFDVVDKCDRVIGQAPRDEVHARQLRHRAVHVLVLNSRGELFIQKRAGTKDSFPGRYDSSASGHLATGESYDTAAVRELHEELGLLVPVDRLKPLTKIEADHTTGWEFTWVYILRGDDPPRPNPSEIESGEFWVLARLVSKVTTHPDLFAPSFVRVLHEFMDRETVANS